jgi:hypothetical protein
MTKNKDGNDKEKGGMTKKKSGVTKKKMMCWACWSLL